MSELVDNTGKEMNTKEDAKEKLPNENGETEHGTRIGDQATTENEKDVQQRNDVARIEVIENTFVVKIPVQNNLYQVLSQLLWAEDRIRQIYADAQIRKMQNDKKILNPGFLKTFRNKWGR